MFIHSAPLCPISTLAIVLSSVTLCLANPFPRTLLNDDFLGNHSLELRDGCAGVTCGWNGWLCCGSGQACATSNNQALCIAAATQAAGGGSWQVYTTTYVEIDQTTITTTYSALAGGAAPTSSPGGSCNANLGQTQCGTQCCNQDEWCNGNECIGYGGSSSGAPITNSQGSTISNFIAPTSVGIATVTSSMSITTTIPFQTPVGSSGSAVTGQMVSTNNGLSPGAIAGIVIGVLVGLFLLFLILACLCCRSIFDSIFGRKKRKETTTYIETHHSHHGSAAAPPPRRRWFGVLPARPDRPQNKTGGYGGLVGVGAFLAALAVILGLRRRSNKNKVEEKTEYSVSDYTYSYDDYTTSASKYRLPNKCSRD